MFKSFTLATDTGPIPGELARGVGRSSPASAPDPLPAGRPGSERAVRALDMAVAVAAIVFFAPLMLLIACMVRLSGGPVFFRQSRVGRDGVPFTCLKFRTMHVDSDGLLRRVLAHDPDARAEWERDHKLRNDPRVIPMGRLLRKLSLDELPQLFCVLQGSMSIVGPRPIVHAESYRYGRYFETYCRVRPGLTGLWQISGRNATTYRRRIACDVAYVRGKSLARDVQIMLKTIPAVCLARGAY